jgi:hypothetical protein
MDLPHSDDSFVVAFPAENTESFLEGHNRAFAHFGGVPNTILNDTTRIAVGKITGDGERKPTESFSELQSHYLFAAKFGRPGKGNDKGNVEGLVGYARRNFMVPVPRVASWEALNQHLLQQCIERRARKVHGENETISKRFKRDQEKLLALPATPHEACHQRTTRASSQALVRYETNDYSVPVAYRHRQVLVKAFVWEVVISASNEVIARHTRSYRHEEMIFGPLQLSGVAGTENQRARPGSVVTKLAVAGGVRRATAPDGSAARQTRAARVRAGITLAGDFLHGRGDGRRKAVLALPAIAFDAVKHLLLCAIEQRLPKLGSGKLSASACGGCRHDTCC